MNRERYGLVMAVYLNTRGFGFAVFEGPLSPVDWGIVEARGSQKNKTCVRRISQLFGRYRPEVLVLQDTSTSGTRRARRICDLNEAVALLAETQGIAVVSYSRDQVRACFSCGEFASKQRIAEAITRHIPVFTRYLPPPRKLWNSEHVRMALFDAVALALTFFNARQQ